MSDSLQLQSINPLHLRTERWAKLQTQTRSATSRACCRCTPRASRSSLRRRPILRLATLGLITLSNALCSPIGTSEGSGSSRWLSARLDLLSLQRRRRLGGHRWLCGGPSKQGNCSRKRRPWDLGISPAPDGCLQIHVISTACSSGPSCSSDWGRAQSPKHGIRPTLGRAMPDALMCVFADCGEYCCATTCVSILNLRAIWGEPHIIAMNRTALHRFGFACWSGGYLPQSAPRRQSIDVVRRSALNSVFRLPSRDELAGLIPGGRSLPDCHAE